MADKDGLIAVIDSGVGGISVLQELVKCMPREQFLYFGDSANAPYGSRTKEQVQQLTLQTVKRLQKRNLKALVVACNTATAAAIDLLRATWPELIIIGIEPALKPAVQQFPQGAVGVMATPVTLQGDKLHRLMEAYPHPKVHCIPAPGLVELVEAGLADSPRMDAYLHTVLDPYAGKLQALVLGCTHYPFAKRAIARVLGPQTVLFDGGPGTARETRRRLEEQNLLSQGPGRIYIENSLPGREILELSHKLLTEVI